MALISKATSTPGRATATQSPFAIGPVGGGGMDFGGLLSRQMALREQMQKLQMQRMQQEMFEAKRSAQRQNEMYATSRTTPGGLSAAGPEQQAKMDARQKSMQFAEALHGSSWGERQADPRSYQNIQGMIQALGVPAAQRGMMQSGQILGQLGSAALRGGGGIDVAAQRNQLLERLQQQDIQGGAAEEGGRVPKTGTYKLHKGEIVVPSKAADVMFPYMGKKMSAKGRQGKPGEKPLKSYQGGSLEGLAGWSAGVPGEPLPPPIFSEEEWEGLSDYAKKATSAAFIGGPQVDKYGPGPPGFTGPPEPPPEPPTAPTEYEAPEGGGRIEVLGRGAKGMTSFGVPGQLSEEVREKRFFDLPTRPVTAQSQLRDEELKMAHYERQSDYHRGRANLLQQYADEQGVPNAKLEGLVKGREKSAAYWDRQYASAEKRMMTYRTQMVTEMIAQAETSGKVGAAIMKGEGELGKEHAALAKDLNAAYVDILKSDVNDAAKQQAFAGTFGRFIPDYAGKVGISPQQMADRISTLLLEVLGGGPEAQIANNRLSEIVEEMARMRRVGGGIE